jgi:hypothetical protein
MALWQGSWLSDGQQINQLQQFTVQNKVSAAVERAYFSSTDSDLGAAAPQQCRCYIVILRESGSIWPRLLHSIASLCMQFQLSSQCGSCSCVSDATLRTACPCKGRETDRTLSLPPTLQPHTRASAAATCSPKWVTEVSWVSSTQCHTDKGGLLEQ